MRRVFGSRKGHAGETHMIELVVSYIHILAFMVMAACLSVEAMLLASHDGRNTAEDLGRADITYFIAAAVVLLAGAVKMVLSTKGFMYFVGNPVFLIKVLLFFAAAAISLIPTSRYGRWRMKAHMDPGFRIPAAEAHSTLRLVLVELVTVFTLPLLAVMMARGVGG